MMKISIILIGIMVVFSVVSLADEVVIKDVKPFSYVGIETTGSYAQIPAKVGEFGDALFGQKLTPQGHLFGIYLNDPMKVKESELKWIIGFPMDIKTEVKAPLKKGEYKFTKVAYYLRKGPYDQVGKTYEKMFAFIAREGYKPAGPSLEKYLNDSHSVKPEEIITEIFIPVTK
jgi:effector-binding domain-containing protein